MTIESAPTPTIDDRFENMIIAPERVLEMLGRQPAGAIRYEHSEQGDARRELLHIEKVAIENRRLQEKTEATYMGMVSHQFHDILLSEMTECLGRTTELFTSILNIPENIGELFDALAVRACSVSKLEPIVATMPWLYDELVTLVNTPRFRRKDARGRIIVVDSLRTALSFLGIENLRLLIPNVVLKRAIPQVTDPYPQIKQRLSAYATGVSLTARHIAQATDLYKNEAYTLGLLSNLGRCAVIRLYFKLFDKIQIQLMKECQKNKEQKRYEALIKLVPSANHIIALEQEFADSVSAHVLDKMQLKRLQIAQPMRTCATSAPAQKSTLSKVLHQSRAYTQIRMLHQLNFVEPPEVKPLFREQKFPRGTLETLKHTDIFTLPLTKN